MQALRDRGQDGQEEFIAGAAADPADPPVVIVGAGPVGVHYARLLRAAAPEIPVVLYGNEPWEPYDRVQLSTLLAGQRRMDQVMATPFDTADGGLETRLNCAVTRISARSALVMVTWASTVAPAPAAITTTTIARCMRISCCSMPRSPGC